MAKHARIRLIALAVAACALLLAACAGDASAPGAKDAQSQQFVGSWELYDADYHDDGDDIDHDTYRDLAELMGWHATLDLDAEGNAVSDFTGTVNQGSWQPAGEGAATITLSGTPFAARLADGLLCMEVEGASLRFEKVSDTPEMEHEAREQAGMFSEEEGNRAYVDSVTRVRELDMEVCATDSCTVRVLAIGSDYAGDPGILLEIENKTDDVVYLVNEDDFTVNGGAADAVLMRVVPGSYTSRAFLYFSGEDVGAAEDISSISGSISVYDAGETCLGTWRIEL